ncbi:uncharacterized protein RSE6_14609 [Rhynchosporium secalis]|uniref:Heterokaryon incompatibility domain-containing protein n=1 Tax=Rhynchosporium secalis TaxID=38038 RepID=A0A1E1MVP3_RHYSE|nr:uncharacterized protein RSE6_14609 [Rhynchosporium secalis]
MRLLKFTPDGNLSLTEFSSHQLPQYAILSHTWGKDGDEVTSQEIPVDPRNKAGYAKIEFCGKRAAEDGLEYFWVDTCCIDKTSSAELQEAIGPYVSMLHEITGIAISALQGGDLLSFSVPERLTWAETRQTKREEDEAYSLFGIFDVRMSLDYGEGKTTAFERLQEEICKHAGKRHRDEV